MRYTNLGNFKKINPYVKWKLSLLNKEDFDFAYLFSLMFSEEKNTMFEESIGFKINKITYGEAKENAFKKANAIRQIIGDASYNSVIGINLDNSHHWIESFWAILIAGCRPLLLNKRLDTTSLNKTLENTEAILVISDDEKRFNVKTIRLEDLEITAPKYEGDFGSELFVMSSGTTNNVKVCAYSASELQYIIKQSKHIFLANKKIKKHYQGELKLLAFLPFYHIFGFVALYIWFGFFSRTFVRLNDLTPATIQATIKRHHITHIFAVPLLWQKTYEAAIREIKAMGEKTENKFYKGMKIAKATRSIPLLGKLFRKLAFKEVREKLFGDSVYFMITGGSVIEEKVLSFFNYIGYHLANGYGMSEIGITSVELSNNLKFLTSGAIGKPLPYVNYHINDNGELIVTSKGASKYIIEGDKKIENGEVEFLTHDLSKKIKDRYYLYGREDDLVVSISGENLNPNIIEAELSIDGINGLCLILNKENGVPTLLVSVNKYTSSEYIEKLKVCLKLKLIANNLDKQIGKIEAITTPLIQGDEFKLNRKRLADDYINHRLTLANTNVDEQAIDDAISLKVKEFFSLVLGLPVEETNNNLDFFSDYGGTSLDFLIVDNKIKEEFNVSILSNEELKHTVTDIAEFIKKNL